MKNIIFAIPMNNVVIAPFFVNFFEAVMGLVKKGHKVSLLDCNDTYIYESRWKITKLITKAYEDGDISDNDSYVIWLDSDQCDFSTDTIVQLINQFETNKQFDILSAVYYARSYPPNLDPRIVAMHKTPNNPDLYKFITDYSYGEYINVDVVGMGMCIMKPSLLYAIKQKYGKMMFHPKIMDDEHIKGEDVIFCEHVRQEGFMIGLTTSIQIGHGFYTINKNVADALRGLRNERRKTLKVDDLDPDGIKHII